MKQFSIPITLGLDVYTLSVRKKWSYSPQRSLSSVQNLKLLFFITTKKKVSVRFFPNKILGSGLVTNVGVLALSQ
jgi:hypothetical protein